MSKIYFSCNIIIFDTYQMPSKLSINNKIKQENNISKAQIYNNINKSQFIGNNKNKVNEFNFFEENNINLYNSFMNREISYFPIIRIFGTTKSGQKCCVNIHNYFPYFYISITKENYFNYNNKGILQAFAVLLENTYIEYKNEINKTKYFNGEEKNKDNSQEIIKEEQQVINNVIL